MMPTIGTIYRGHGFTFELLDVLETVRFRVTAPTGTKSRLSVPLAAFEQWEVGLKVVKPLAPPPDRG